MGILTADGRNVERIGHRGSPRRFRENTIPSFNDALSLGADAVELDVHVTADGAVVVHHDPTLGRSISPSRLRGRPIHEMSAEEIAGVDLGSGESIPLLSEVLELIGGRARVYVEIKAGDLRPIVEIVRASRADCAIHSFDHDAIVQVSRLAPDIPRGVLIDSRPDSLERIVAATGARDVWPRVTLIDRPLIESIGHLGCRTIAWTVNDSSRAAELVAWGVDGLCGDDVTRFASPPGN